MLPLCVYVRVYMTCAQVTYKSEEVLPEDLEQPVKVVKGKSFNDIVSGSSGVRVLWQCRGRAVLAGRLAHGGVALRCWTPRTQTKQATD